MIIRIVFLLTIFASLMSQLPIVLDNDYDGYLKAMWLIPFAFLGIFKFKTYTEKPLWFMYVGTLCMLFYCAICEAFTGQNYMNIDLYNMSLSLMIGITSYSLFRNYYSKTLLFSISIISMIGSLILCLYLYELYFIDYDIMDRMYAFKAKNAMGQILFNCSIVIALYSNSKNIFVKSLQYFSIAIILVMLCMLKSRATLIGVFFTIAYMIVQSRSKVVRWATVFVVSLSLTYIFMNDYYYDMIFNGILFAGRDISDINELSSERVYTIEQALEVIPRNLWIGIGDKYIDCMPVAMILQFGLLGAAIVFAYIGVTLSKVLSLDRDNKIHLVTYLLMMAMMLNSLFEAQPPFGPGVKCFMLWMALGFSLGYEKTIQDNRKYASNNYTELTPTEK